MKKHLLYSSILGLSIPTLGYADTTNIHVLSATVKDQNIANAQVILQKMVNSLHQLQLMQTAEQR